MHVTNWAEAQREDPVLSVVLDFQLEYQKGRDSTVADVLSQITTCLCLEAEWSVLDGLTLGVTHRAEGYGPVVVKGDCGAERGVHVPTGWL